MIVIVDYGRGNLFSLGQALAHLGVEYEISGAPDRIESAERIIFPGVGAFGEAMNGLRERGLVEPLKAAAAKGTPILGICVGCQLLLSRGEEFGDHAGLDLVPGTVSRLPARRPDDSAAIRIPNVGWRQMQVNERARVLGGVGEDDMMYFVHSYAPMARDADAVAATVRINGADIPVAVEAGNIVGVQFHPEKSGPAGLKILQRFLETKFDA